MTFSDHILLCFFTCFAIISMKLFFFYLLLSICFLFFLDEWNANFVVGSGKPYVSEAIIQSCIVFTWIKCSVDMLNKLLDSAINYFSNGMETLLCSTLSRSNPSLLYQVQEAFAYSQCANFFDSNISQGSRLSYQIFAMSFRCQLAGQLYLSAQISQLQRAIRLKSTCKCRNELSLSL